MPFPNTYICALTFCDLSCICSTSTVLSRAVHPFSSMTAGSASAQEISDTIALRKRIQDCFELAAVPGTSEADMRRTLHFIVVGGGPTGAASAGRSPWIMHCAVCCGMLLHDMRRG